MAADLYPDQKINLKDFTILAEYCFEDVGE